MRTQWHILGLVASYTALLVAFIVGVRYVTMVLIP